MLALLSSSFKIVWFSVLIMASSSIRRSRKATEAYSVSMPMLCCVQVS